jgi:hypothetical protein
MVHSGRTRRWPAYAVAALFLGYAAGKAVFAAQARLGFPGGPPVSAAEAENYFLDPATAQWFATASGLAGACIALATVTPLGRKVPRALMLLVLAGMTFAVGVGWRWYHGVLGLVVGALFVEMVRSYVMATRRVTA